jgi:hypothetical protein
MTEEEASRRKRVIEVMDAIMKGVGVEKVGVWLSPWSLFHGGAFRVYLFLGVISPVVLMLD